MFDMRISIVIPTHNRKDVLRQCLMAAGAQDYPDYEIIVVDDNSTDGTGEMVQREFPAVRYVRQELNRGPAAARNRGIDVATGEIVAFTDDDCLVPANWLARLQGGYRRFPAVAGVGGYLEPAHEIRAQNIYARYEWFMARHKGNVLPEEYLGGFETPGGGTSNVSYRRSILVEIDGFDEAFPFAAGEDTDLKKRICARGHPLLYLPVVVTHLRRSDRAGFARSHVARGRAVVRFERKHRGRPPTVLRIILRAAKRTALLAVDLVRIRDAELALVKWQAGLFDCYGQWLEVRRR